MDSYILYGTIVYVFLQIVLLVWLGIRLKNKGRHAHTNTAASILTIFGVFGTFLGIFVGLWDFDVNSIEASIPGLLEGLKFAFFTSIVGIGSAFYLKLRALLRAKGDESGESIEKFVISLTNTLQNVQTSGEMNLLAQLVTLNTTIEREGSETRRTLDDIKTDLTDIHTSLTGGQNETSAQLRDLTTTVSNKHDLLASTIAEKHDNLVYLQAQEGNQTREKLTTLQSAITDGQREFRTELENLTTTFSNKHDLLISEFQAFSKNVAESVAKLATDELIDALKTVIEDFNAKITAQFGEDFKQLNEAVGKTVAWQEQYRQQMEELADEFRVAAEGIEKSRESVALIAESSNTISSRSESIVACTEKLDPILHTLNDQLDAFSELRQRALEAFPLIENRLNELTEGFSNAVQRAIRDSHESVETQRNALTTQSTLLQQLENTLNKMTTDFSDTVATAIGDSHRSMETQRDALTAHSEALQAIIRNITEQVDGIMQEVLKTVDTSQSSMNHQRQELSNLTQQLQSNFNALEATLEAGLTESLESLAGKLAALSDKFVDDYTPLTEELYRLVNMARSNQADQCSSF